MASEVLMSAVSKAWHLKLSLNQLQFLSIFDICLQQCQIADATRHVGDKKCETCPRYLGTDHYAGGGGGRVVEDNFRAAGIFFVNKFLEWIFF